MTRHPYYDRGGNPISAEAWAELRRDFSGYVVVAKTDVDDGVSVSTVWLGINHALHGEVPEIFETMVFGGPMDEWCWRTPNEVAALARHDQAVAENLELLRQSSN